MKTTVEGMRFTSFYSHQTPLSMSPLTYKMTHRSVLREVSWYHLPLILFKCWSPAPYAFLSITFSTTSSFILICKCGAMQRNGNA